MAWTAPMTFVANSALTAAQLNTHLRDNLFETEVAKALQVDDYMVTEAPNRIGRRYPRAARVDTDETTVSLDYVDLATIGPSVTVTTGTRLFVIHKANIYNDNTNSAGGMSFSVAGLQPDGSDGTAIDPNDIYQTLVDGVPLTSSNTQMNFVNLPVTAGSNTVTSKYKVGSGNGHFRYRVIAALGF